MNKTIIAHLILILVFSCYQKQKVDATHEFKSEFYSVLDTLLKSRFSNASFIIHDTRPLYKTTWGEFYLKKEERSVPPPPDSMIFYTWRTFETRVEKGWLNRADALYMHNSIDSMITFTLDSSRVNIPLVSDRKRQEFFTDKELSVGYQKITETYGNRCFLETSTPLFNPRFTKCILTIHYFCGPLNAHGFLFDLEKVNGEWKILEEENRWGS